MRKFTKLLFYELKNIIKDKMTVILLVYPLMVIAIGSFILPALLDRFGGDTPGTRVAALVMIILFATIAPFIGSVLLGFSLLDNRDENTLDTIRVTPLSLRGYILFKTVYTYVLTVLGSFFVVFGTKTLSGDGYTIMGVDLFADITVGLMFVYALTAGLFTPVFAFMLAAVSKNKIEGFAYMKTSGMIVLIPMLAVIETMQDAKQYVLGIVPLFWPAKGLMVGGGLFDHPSDLPMALYMVFGALYMLALAFIGYRFFERNVSG